MRWRFNIVKIAIDMLLPIGVLLMCEEGEKSDAEVRVDSLSPLELGRGGHPQGLFAVTGV